MLTIYFFYGLAFIVLSAVIFLMPRREDCFGLGKSMIFIGWFGLLHGLSGWVDLLIFAEGPLSIEILSVISGVLLPLSFTFLVIFGCVTISNIKGYPKWLKAVWILFPLLWISASIAGGNISVSGILARYLLCVPGTILTSLAIYLSLKRCDIHETPKPVMTGAWFTIIFFLLYGVFSGMVTPKASFFPASMLNYTNFLNVFHAPVQLFRMACAIMVSCGFIMLIGTFSRKRPGQSVEGTIKGKLTIIIFATVAAITLAGMVLTYFVGASMLMRVSGKEYAQIAHSLNLYTIGMFNGEIEDVESYATRPLWRDIVRESNSRYEGMDAGSISQKLLDIDKRWITAKPGDPILKEYLENRVSVSANEVMKMRKNISELFITDKYGALVAASGKTSDFYQADEDWWQKAYNGGKGSVYVSDIEFDKSSKGWVISIAVPIKDQEGGEVIGICKDSVGVDRFFSGLADFNLGATGHSVLINDKGMVIFHHGIPSMTDKILTEEALRKILTAKDPYVVIKSGMFYHRNVFVAISEMKVPFLPDGDVSWIMLVVQDMSEVSMPINNFIIQIVIIAILMLILTIPIGAFFGRIVSDPIHELHIAMEKIISGDWNYKIDIKTGDEIEQFAGTFREMISNIRSKQLELQGFSSGLELKVEERTKELSVAQEATLNMLEDLQASKEALERTNRELLKLDELKSDFISTISHELRTPLSIIKEGISLVLDKIPGEINEKQTKILDISKSNIDRLARIIDNLLDISKIEAGKVELKRSLVDISDIVKQAADSFSLKAKEKGLEMRLDIDKTSGRVWADTNRIIQVLTNLIGNAIKFTSSGHIDISCKDKGDGVVCSVSDTGVGISKDDITKIFDKFQQFGRTAGAGDKGTGLGLSIAKNIVEMHNGAIWVESEFGKGSKFAFKLHKYTPESLFKEYVSKAVKAAADKGTEMSIIAVNASLEDEDVSGVISKRFSDIIYGSVRLIKSTLRREGDDIINNGGEIIVILADCDKENAARVQYRFEEIVGKYLADQKVDGAIKVRYGYATYPDDAKDEPGLMEKTKAVENRFS